MSSLDDVRDRVIRLIGGPQFLGFVNARLVLRTGISLNDGASAQFTKADLLKVVAALRDMGYPVDGEGATT